MIDVPTIPDGSALLARHILAGDVGVRARKLLHTLPVTPRPILRTHDENSRSSPADIRGHVIPARELFRPQSASSCEFNPERDTGQRERTSGLQEDVDKKRVGYKCANAHSLISKSAYLCFMLQNERVLFVYFCF